MRGKIINFATLILVTDVADKRDICRVNKNSCSVAMCSVSNSSYSKSKRVWIWTENKQVMTAAVERGWNTFVFLSENQQLAKDWSS